MHSNVIPQWPGVCAIAGANHTSQNMLCDWDCCPTLEHGAVTPFHIGHLLCLLSAAVCVEWAAGMPQWKLWTCLCGPDKSTPTQKGERKAWWDWPAPRSQPVDLSPACLVERGCPTQNDRPMCRTFLNDRDRTNFWLACFITSMLPPFTQVIIQNMAYACAVSTWVNCEALWSKMCRIFLAHTIPAGYFICFHVELLSAFSQGARRNSRAEGEKAERRN